ncbi:hypothetical protein D3C85_133230 [compost metagenome]
MHGQDHDGAEKDEQRVSALFECVHESFLQVFGLIWCVAPERLGAPAQESKNGA